MIKRRSVTSGIVFNYYHKAVQTLYLFVPLFILHTALIHTCRRLCGFILIALCCLFSKAQTTGDWYLSKILNDNNGLPQNSVRSVYYDKKTDFLWLATEAGLVRYDGQNARVFDKREMPYLQSMRIHNLFPTVSGEVLGCNLLGEIFTLHTNYPQPGIENYKGKPNDIIYRRGNVKSISGLAIEAKISISENISIDYKSPTLWLNDTTWISQSDSSIFLAYNSRIVHRWPIRQNGGLVFIARGKWVYAVNSRGKGYCLDVVSKAQIATVVQSGVFATDSTLFIYNKLNDQPLLLRGNDVHEIIFKDSTVSTKLIATLPKVPGFITELVFDKTRRYLFIGTNATGLYIYHRSPFKVYAAAGDDIVNDNYACLLIDSQHILTSQSRLFNLSDATSEAVPITIGSDRALAMDGNRNIWGVQKPNFIRFNIDRPGQLLKIPLADTNLIQTIYRANNSRIWFSTSAQLSFVSGNTIQPFLNYPDPKTAWYFIAETPAGVLMGMNRKGIFELDTLHKKIIPVIQNAELSQGRFFLIDNDYRCWIATYGNGIFLYNFKTKKLTRLPVDDKGYLQYGHTFIDDGKGNFLVPSNKGLFRLSKNNLLQIEQFPETPLCYQYFDVNDGLLTNEFNGGCQPAYNRLPDGDIILPALQGLVRVKVKELPDPSGNVLFIDGIENRLNRYNASNGIQFKSNERVQAWNLGFTQWDRPNGQGIFYRLDKDSTWQRLPVGEKQIRLSELNGGNHTLEIKYQYGLQPQQVTIVNYHFSVGRYYYETTIFWLTMLFLLGGIIYLAVRIRSRQLKNKNIQLQQIIKENTQELSDNNMQLEETLRDLNEALKGLQENSVFKNRLIGLLGHDMLVPLRFIARVANHLHNDAATLSPEAASENSGEIQNTATELLYLGESLIQWIKLQEGTFHLIIQQMNLQQLAEEIMQVHLPIAAVKHNRLICTISADLFVQFDPVFIKIILHNLLLNANKFTSGGSITIAAVVTENELQIQVTDTGIGMTETIVNSLNTLMPVPSNIGTHKESGFGMGYMLIIDLLRFAEGTLLVESKVGEGTTVTFKLPVQHTL